MHRLAPTLRVAVIGLLVLVAAGCSDGQLVDAGGENGGGGLAFVLMAFFFLSFIGALFYMDRVRTRRSGDSQK
ncbi:MAG: hypothetical protein JJE46_14865 [Acidimicrobiia bacterium]|nr:hypothetical protein [Acidimicrobiia bacterium]